MKKLLSNISKSKFIRVLLLGVGVFSLFLAETSVNASPVTGFFELENPEF